MRKIFIFCTLISISAISLFGQSDVKRINSIKRDPAYMWQEATAESEQAAYDAAETGLLAMVIEYVTDNVESGAAYNTVQTDLLGNILSYIKLNPKPVNETSKVKNVLSQYTDRISMPRGEMTRVFLYIQKSHLNPPVQTPEPEPVYISEPAPVETPVTASESAAPSQSDDVAINEQSLTELKYEDPIPDTIPQVVPEIPKAWQREVVKKLSGADDIVAANAMLARMKAEYKIKKYGPFAQCRDLDKSWLIIFDDSGRIKALLGTQKDGRPDYMSKTYKSLSDYSGMNAVWFVFAE